MPEMGVDHVRTSPPEGKKKIKNIYWDPDTQEIVIDHED